MMMWMMWMMMMMMMNFTNLHNSWHASTPCYCGHACYCISSTTVAPSGQKQQLVLPY